MNATAGGNLLLETGDRALRAGLHGRPSERRQAQALDVALVAGTALRLDVPTRDDDTLLEQLAADLAARGLVIVSGLARGVDSAAHRGALSVHGRTLAVLGCGADVVYPREHAALAADIARAGAIVIVSSAQIHQPVIATAVFTLRARPQAKR